MMGGDPLLSGFEDPEEYGFETRAIRAGQPHDQRTGGVVTPIAMSTTFAQEAPGSPKHGYEYSRTGNPRVMRMKLVSRRLKGPSTASRSRAALQRKTHCSAS